MTVMVGQLRIKVLKELGKFGHHVGHQKYHHHQHHRHQQRGIHQRHGQLLLESQGQPLKRDIAAEHFFHVAAFLTRHQRGGVNPRKHSLRRKGVGQQLAALHPVPHILQPGLQVRVLLPLDQQIQRTQDGQARLDQGQELLVEDHELALPDLPPAELQLSPGKQAPRLYPIDQVTLLHEALADLGFRVTMLHLLRQVAAIIRDFYQKLGHVLVCVTSLPTQV